ncbi:MAG: type II secretion system protein GspL [bacterium]
MNERVVILLAADPAAPIEWGLVGDGGLIATGQVQELEQLAQISDLQDYSPLHIIIPGEWVAARHLHLVTKNKRQIEKAAHFFLDDELAETANGLHILTKRQEASQTVALAAVNAEIIDAIKDLLEYTHFSIESVTADFYLLPESDEETICILQDKQRFLYASHGRGFAVASQDAKKIITPILHQQKQQGYPVKLICVKDSDPALWLQSAIDSTEPIEEDLFAYLAPRAGAEPSYNFMQGRFGKTVNWKELYQPLRLSAMLFIFAVFLFFATIFVQAIHYNQETEQITKKTTTLYENKFPGRSVANLRRDLRSLNAASIDQGLPFLNALASIAKVVNDAEKIDLTGLSYNRQGQIILDIRFSDFNDLDALKQALDDIGFMTREGRNQSGAGRGFYATKLFVEVKS